MKFKFLLLALASVLCVQTADAATRTVTSLNDDGGAGTLRSLIAASAANDTINFANGLAGTITLTAGELVIGRNLTIIGPEAASLTLSGNSTSRVFNVMNGTVHISSLTIINGRAAGINGANGTSMFTQPAGSPGGDGIGGGILNHGNLILTRCTLSGNSAIGGNGGEYYPGSNGTGGAAAAGSGGGIYNNGTLTLTNCTLFANIARGGNGGYSYWTSGAGGNSSGGAIFNQSNLTVVNCTLSTNTATGGNAAGSGTVAAGGGVALGGGVYSANSVSIVNTIIASGTVTGGMGGFDTFGGGPDGYGLGPDVFGPVNSQGHNLIRAADGSSGWIGSDLTGTVAAPLNPLLAPLAFNGGPTKTMTLQPTSAAIDAGDDSVTNSLATDQRGRPRKSGAHVDIGAVEMNPITLVVSNLNNSGVGSLRQAISDAGSTDGDTVTFAPNVVGTIVLTSGELVLDKSLTIQGPASVPIIVSGNNASRVFRITSASTVSISSLTISNGNTGTFGAGFYNDFDCTLVLSNCAIVANISGNAGGGIANNGSVAAYNCTFASNRSTYAGGGIYTYAGPVTLLNCTVVSNRCGLDSGGGLANYSLVAGTSNYVASTLVSGNSALFGHHDVIGVFTSGGYNLIGQIDYSTPGSGVSVGVPTSGLTNGVNHDQVGSIGVPIDPKLGRLQNNGGPTPTMALLSNSPAIDKGISNGLLTDQRGAPRPFDFASIANAAGGDGRDIGAFELGSPTLNIQKFTTNAVLAWQSYYGDFTLHSVTNVIASNSWTTVAGTPVVVANQYVLTNGPISGNKFYRLKGN